MTEHDCRALALKPRALIRLIREAVRSARETDENMGDAIETFDSILYWTSEGRQGRCWGHCWRSESPEVAKQALLLTADDVAEALDMALAHFPDRPDRALALIRAQAEYLSIPLPVGFGS